MSRRFAGVQSLGCTTAGEIGPAGCRDHSIAGVSLAPRSARPLTGLLEHLHQFDADEGRPVAQELLYRLDERSPAPIAATASPFCSSTALGA